MSERSNANEQVEITDEYARSSEPSAFPAKACGNVGIEPKQDLREGTCDKTSFRGFVSCQLCRP